MLPTVEVLGGGDPELAEAWGLWYGRSLGALVCLDNQCCMPLSGNSKKLTGPLPSQKRKRNGDGSAA